MTPERSGGGPARLRSGSSCGLRLALVALGMAVLALCGLELELLLSGPVEPEWALYLFPGVALVYFAAGLLAWDRRPSNGFGAVLFLGGAAALAAGLLNADVKPLAAVGLLLTKAPIGVVLHILLAFPSGRLRDPASRALVIAGYFVTLVLQAPQYLFSTELTPFNPFHVADRPDLADAGTRVQDTTGALVIVATAYVLLRRLRAADPAQRLVLGSLSVYGIAAILFLEVSANVLPELFGTGPLTVFWLQMAVLAGVPVAFVAGMLRGGFARTGELEELGVWLGTGDGARPGLRDALARTLGDDSLELLFWIRSGGYVTAGGRRVELPQLGSGRAAAEIELGGERIGAVVYDAQLTAEPERVRAAGRVIALALERERLTADLLAGREALRESRARIVEAGDRERRRIAQDLHDGLQGRLVVLGMRAGQLAAAQPAVAGEAGAIRSGLEAAADEVRRLVQGVMPAVLLERGLYAAAEDLADRMPVPTRVEVPDGDGKLPPAVESAGYFVVAEALANALKHSKARELVVRLTRSDGRLEIEVCDDGVGGAALGTGAGLRGIADRLDALGGRMHVDSPLDGGTRLLAELPCGS